MCGRMNIIDDPLAQVVSDLLGIAFTTQSNPDVRPTDRVSAVSHTESGFEQLDLAWGIKPSWSKRVLINAQAETVASKPTFRAGFELGRVVVPCSGWYEWREENGKKQKYLFRSADGSPLYMAAVALESNQNVVTLTTQPNSQCEPYHHRMPFLVPHYAIEAWLTTPARECESFLTNQWQEELDIIDGN
ncbi:SOS response-associated peptidase [uncultured Vibrio sp.]|uniref:SOS response-associated peptidase n=1 Tax=uncultured Vibrio sp. TaxID=114054 RepID=UPI0025DAED89|nr:SOS response-associated peptidase family protein [uncultured Vibrio sp.]